MTDNAPKALPTLDELRQALGELLPDEHILPLHALIQKAGSIDAAKAALDEIAPQNKAA